MKKVLSTVSMPTLVTTLMLPMYMQTVSAEVALSEKQNVTVLEPVTVTGEKTSRSLRDTASSVMVITDESLKDMPAVTTSNNVLDHIPNIVTVEPGNDAPAVRGVDGTGPASGANAFFAGTRPRLNYQVDGRTLGFNETLFQDISLWDVSQVEVYRGPQSTQQGRNSIAGAIVIRTADPTFDWEGKVRGMVGEQKNRVGSVAISGPIVEDVLAFRLAADYQSSETAVDFTPYEQEDDPNLYRTEMFRGKLLYTPGTAIRSMLTFGRTDGRAPQSERVVRPFEDRVAEFPNQPTFQSRNTYGIWDTSWIVSDNMAIEVNLSKTDFRTERHSPPGLGNLRIDGDETVFQPLIRLNTEDGDVSGFVGAYLFRTEQDEVIDVLGGGGFRDETESDALFGEVSWWINDVYNLTVGARYEEEQRTRVGSAGPLALDFKETYREFLPKATLSWEVHKDWTIGFTAGRGYNGGGAGITFSPPFAAYTYDPEFVWNYEGFARGSMLNGRLGLTANIFYNDFEDMQLPFTLAANSTVIRNAEKASTYGIEAGLNYLFSPGNEMFADLGLLQTKVDRYADPTVEDNELARSPAFSLELGLVTTPLTHFEISANVRYTDAYYSDATNTPRGKVDAYALANAQMAYTLKSTRFYITVENLFDSDNEVLILTGATADADSATLLNPRTIMAGVEYSF